MGLGLTTFELSCGAFPKGLTMLRDSCMGLVHDRKHRCLLSGRGGWELWAACGVGQLGGRDFGGCGLRLWHLVVEPGTRVTK